MDIKSISLEEAVKSDLTYPQRVHSSIKTLEGILHNMMSNKVVDDLEKHDLRSFFHNHRDVFTHKPFDLFKPYIFTQCFDDNTIDEEEWRDIMYLVDHTLKEYKTYNEQTSGLKMLSGFLANNMSDKEIRLQEVETLERWLKAHKNLQNNWPYDEVFNLIDELVTNKDSYQHNFTELKNYLESYLTIFSNEDIERPKPTPSKSMKSIFTPQENILIHGKLFCLTGIFEQTKKEVGSAITQLGGTVLNRIAHNIEYLVVGTQGNKSWAFTNYGRKVDQALKLQKEGHDIQIVHETDLWEVIEQLSS